MTRRFCAAGLPRRSTESPWCVRCIASGIAKQGVAKQRSVCTFGEKIRSQGKPGRRKLDPRAIGFGVTRAIKGTWPINPHPLRGNCP